MQIHLGSVRFDLARSGDWLVRRAALVVTSLHVYPEPQIQGSGMFTGQGIVCCNSHLGVSENRGP